MGKDILNAGFSKLKRGWQLVPESKRISFVIRSAEHAGLGSLEANEATAIIEGIKSGQVNAKSQAEADMVQSYTDILNRHGVIDFQDILLKTNEAIRTGDVSPIRVDHLMLDEFQDTDKPQFDWAMLHKDAILTALGDDDQSIYQFRRALGYAGMVDFEKRLQARKIVLGRNYRSHSEILAPAAKLILLNQDRMAKNLVAHKGKGGRAWWDLYADRIREAEDCAKRMAKALKDGQSAAVLARTNRRLDDIEAQCVRQKIPYKRAEGGSLLQTPEMTAMMSFMRLVVGTQQKGDHDIALSWLGLTEGELQSVQKIMGNFDVAQLTPAQLAACALSDESRTRLRQAIKRMIDWRILISAGGVNLVVHRLQRMMQDATGDARSQKTLEVVAGIFQKPAWADDDGLDEVEEQLQKIQSMIDQPQKDKDGKESEPAVQLMTAHGSKGLEYDVVWMIGCEDGVFPDDGSSMQEERRLFYVAMTRAKQTLLISASRSPASPFILEAGIDRISEHIGLSGT